MDQNALVDIDLGFGHQLVHDLDREGIHVAVAFWPKFEEYGQWRFFVAAPESDELGFFLSYGRIAAPDMLNMYSTGVS